jgi:hypothetical protein
MNNVHLICIIKLSRDSCGEENKRRFKGIDFK